MSDTPSDPTQDSDPNEGDDQDIEPIGSEQLELGEIQEWEAAVDQSEQGGMGS